jgi:hypothetical protein
MRVVSLVPSWTETLLEAGINVVGRTRFCVHPAQSIRHVPVVGGTKSVDVERIASLAPDLVIVDREENARDMGLRWPLLDTHVRSLADAANDTDRLATALSSPALADQASRWRRLLSMPPRTIGADDLPGVLSWWRRPVMAPEQLLYMIWKKPWMAAGPATFVGDVLRWLGVGDLHRPTPTPYPGIDLDQVDAATTLLLFSSEPYPFQRHPQALTALGFPCALVDGEKFSWFGLRTLRFLEEVADDGSGLATELSP